ncbi:Aste57867_21840 [Aphanomyces stellatus]|uniref:Aste57867_21840 protein n=1 Tax=Aphanomyces stellatus TaxID=120398 RepID=A0A485LJ99_9STRA|nr:hypothetical protein As57867_021771 [Aphanomyces stellatus]VFT98509.1 Aste57867_21840 [Aphanomyces stellatus]
MVVSSPTGSGKTSVFEAAFLRHWKQNQSNLHGGYGKVVYLAPLKALLHERVTDWTKRFHSIGITFVELSDSFDDPQNFLSYDVLLCTPEKVNYFGAYLYRMIDHFYQWDVVTRNSLDVLSCVDLLLVDEIHNIGDGARGATLEAVITRMLYFSSNLFKRKVRVPATSLYNVVDQHPSATFPNLRDIGSWFGCSSDMIFEFGPEFRPVPLDVHVLAMKSPGNEFQFEKSMDHKVPEILTKYSNGKPSLIFCSSRKSTVHLAMMLCAQRLVHLSTPQKQKLTGAGRLLHNSTLKNMVMCGIGFHHAALHESDRHIIENLYIEGFLSILCSTSSLAVGVNLPAHLVIIKSTQIYQGKCGYKEYSHLSIQQMIGRAGRPGYDTCGVAVIMTEKSHEYLYQNIMTAAQIDRIESCLQLSAKEALNSEIVLGTVQDFEEGIEWMKTSFLNCCFQTCPSNYPGGEEMKRNAATVIATTAINELGESRMINFSDDLYDFEATASGRTMCKFYLRYEQMNAISFLFSSKHVTLEMLLDLVANLVCVQFPLRRHDKAILNKINQTMVQFRVKGGTGKYLVQTDQMKSNLLLQSALGRIPIEDDFLSLEMQSCVEVAQRIVRAATEYCIECGAGDNALTSFLFWRSLCCQMWENGPASHKMQQLEGIDTFFAKNLDTNGIHSIRQLRDASPQLIASITNQDICDCSAVISTAKTILDMRLDVLKYSPNHVEIVISSNQANQVHDITGRQVSGYLLLVLSKTQIVLSKRDIIAPCSYVVPLLNVTILSVRLLHMAHIGLDDHVEVNLSQTNEITINKIEKRTFNQLTIPQAFQLSRQQSGFCAEIGASRTGSHEHVQESISQYLIPQHSEDDIQPPKRARLSEPKIPSFDRFRWQFPQTESATSATSDPVRQKHASPIIEDPVPSAHVIPTDDSTMSLEEEFMKYIF